MTHASLFSNEHSSWASSSSRCSRRRTASSYEISSASPLGAAGDAVSGDSETGAATLGLAATEADWAAAGAGTSTGTRFAGPEPFAKDVRARPFVMSRIGLGLLAVGGAAARGGATLALALADLAESAGVGSANQLPLHCRREGCAGYLLRVAWSTVNLIAPTAARVRR